MIISHSKRFIFFAVPKTATHAVRQVLRTHMEEGDWEQQMLFGKQALPIPELAALGHGHLSVAEVQPHLPAEQWHGYTKIAFVRNPYDRFILVCAFLNRDNPGFGKLNQLDESGIKPSAVLQALVGKTTIPAIEGHRRTTRHG